MSSLATGAATARSRPASLGRWFSHLFGRATLIVTFCFVLLAIPTDGYLGPARVTLAIEQAIGSHSFRLAAWETQALLREARELISRPGAGLSDREQHDLVVTYFDAVGHIDDLTNQIKEVYAGSSEANPSEAPALQAELNTLRAQQADRQPAVERILEKQTAAVLAEAGLTTGGRIWPPVRFQFTESPLYLIVSPRDRIAITEGAHLDPTLDLQTMDQIESQVQQRLDVSALVDDTGGFSSYPTMVIEYPSLEWVVSTVAHEWAHTYLMFHPLGWHYDDSSDMHTLNETVASIVGDEIGRSVMLRFYPELVRPAAWPRPLSLRPGWWGLESGERPFEFGPFMRETRLAVDKMLAQGQVAEAEGYMQQRRQTLLDHGYVIRKLNQAYFAFHGSYAVGPAATDPIGGKLRALRDRSASLAEFVRAVARFTTPSALDAALN